MLVARKMDKYRWKLKTHRQTKDSTIGSLYIPPPVLRRFENGQLTPVEALVLSIVFSFYRAHQPCYPTNRWVGERIGVTASRVQQVLRRLIDLKLIKATYMTRDELRDRLEDERCRLRGQLMARLLRPTKAALRSPKKLHGFGG